MRGGGSPKSSTGGSFLRVKRPEYDVGSRSSYTEVKNELSYNCKTRMRLHHVDSDNFTSVPCINLEWLRKYSKHKARIATSHWDPNCEPRQKKIERFVSGNLRVKIFTNSVIKIKIFF